MCVIQEINHQLHNFTVPLPVFRPWSVSLIYWILWVVTRHVPSIFLFLMAAEWLRLLALYDYSICIMMLRTCCCYNLFPLFSSLCLTQHITQRLLEKTLGDGQFLSLSLPLLIFLLLALLSLLMSCLKEDLWISWFPLHWLTLRSAALSIAAPLHGAESKHVVLTLQQ